MELLKVLNICLGLFSPALENKPLVNIPFEDTAQISQLTMFLEKCKANQDLINQKMEVDTYHQKNTITYKRQPVIKGKNYLGIFPISVWALEAFTIKNNTILALEQKYGQRDTIVEQKLSLAKVGEHNFSESIPLMKKKTENNTIFDVPLFGPFTLSQDGKNLFYFKRSQKKDNKQLYWLKKKQNGWSNLEKIKWPLDIEPKTLDFFEQEKTLYANHAESLAIPLSKYEKK